jgi:2-(1,2-epoxy-1,2-dihydrophenyl)acetyl-CoA isomerase
MYNTILLEKANGVGTITLNRPDVYNAINDEISFELQAALKDVTKDPEVRVVVFTASGEKAFCSGQDLKADRGEEINFQKSLKQRYNPIVKLMRNMPKPIICRLNGVAAGAGCSFALASDIIVAADHSSLIEVFVNIGLVLDSGSSYFLPRLVGTQKAFELATTGRKVKAKEALELGMISKVVPLAELDAAVKEYTDFYATAPTKAIGLMKKMLNKSGNANLEEMLEYEMYAQTIAGASKDYTEGVTAFKEKRRPMFVGE